MTTSLTLRNIKGSPLTHTEVDNNFTALRATADGATQGPASATNNSVVLFDGATGKAVKSAGAGLTFDGSSLGIGGAASTKLHVQTTGADVEVRASTLTSGNVRFGFDASGASYNWIQAERSSGAMQFAVGNAEQMRLTSTGLGIGTSAPTATLQINKPNTAVGTVYLNGATTGADFMRLKNTGADGVLGIAGSGGGEILSGGSSYATQIYTVGSTNLQFGTNSTLRATLDTSGNLGLGVTPSAWGAPAKVLELPHGSSLFNYGSTSQTILTANSFYNGSNWIYKNTEAATHYEQVSGAHKWFNAPSGTAGAAISFTQAMTLDSAGNFLLGATTGTNAVATFGNNSSTSGFGVGKYSAFFGTNLSGAISPTNVWGLSIGWNRSAGGGETNIVYGTALGTGPGLAFASWDGTAYTERARIDSAGNLLIGYTSSNGSYKLQVNSQIFATSSTIATSDGRYKENIEPISGALDSVCALNPVQFDWKEHPVHAFDRSAPTVGFIAQEVEQALADRPFLSSLVKRNECVIQPEEIDEDGNVITPAVTEEFLGIAEGNMIALLAAAIKELKAELDAAKARIAAMEA